MRKLVSTIDLAMTLMVTATAWDHEVLDVAQSTCIGRDPLAGCDGHPLAAIEPLDELSVTTMTMIVGLQRTVSCSSA